MLQPLLIDKNRLIFGDFIEEQCGRQNIYQGMEIVGR